MIISPWHHPSLSTNHQPFSLPMTLLDPLTSPLTCHQFVTLSVTLLAPSTTLPTNHSS